MSDFQVSIDTRGMNLEAVRGALANPAPMLKLMAEQHLLNVDTNFRTEAGADGAWKPLTRKYREWKERQSRAIQKKLQFSGLMRAGINYELRGDGTSVAIGSDKVYGPKHEETRSFLKPTAAQIERFGDIASDYLANL